MDANHSATLYVLFDSDNGLLMTCEFGNNLKNKSTENIYLLSKVVLYTPFLCQKLSLQAIRILVCLDAS
jgi:hypothetical protein